MIFLSKASDDLSFLSGNLRVRLVVQVRAQPTRCSTPDTDCMEGSRAQSVLWQVRSSYS